MKRRNQILLIFIALFVVGCTEAIKQEPISVIKISARELASVYDENEIKADKLYKGKTLEVNGSVNDFGEIFSKPYIAINTNLFLYFIRCNLAPSEMSKAATLSKNDQITVVGVNEGQTGVNIDLSNCAIK